MFIFIDLVSGFRKGVWGITLFPPEKVFPHVTVPAKLISIGTPAVLLNKEISAHFPKKQIRKICFSQKYFI